MSHFKNTWQHIRRLPTQSLVAGLVMFITFLSVSVFGSLIFGAHSILNYFEARPEITAFLKDKVSEASVEQLKGELKNSGLVKQIRYVSKEEALKIYQEENKDNPLLLEMISAEFLPASLEIAANNPKDLEKVAEILEGEKEIIEEVIFQKDIVGLLTKWTNILRNLGILIIIFLITTASLVSLVIIGMKVGSHKEEIEIQRLLGAGSFYVYAPFLLEGVFYGFWGSLFGWLVPFVVFSYFRSKIEGFFAGVNFLPLSLNFWGLLLLSEFLLGILIGLFASSLAVKKHLKK